ncbi:hypothetical protein O5D80_005145 [Batrachochytrium dendrobatidis]|nr:hypothetical protein O5D80_005145 [Batrachochytrium dendrobatidis]
MEFFTKDDQDKAHLANFLIGASVALLSACLSSLGVNLQALALKAQREINLVAESRHSLIFIEDAMVSPTSLAEGGGTVPGAASYSVLGNLDSRLGLYMDAEEDEFLFRESVSDGMVVTDGRDFAFMRSSPTPLPGQFEGNGMVVQGDTYESFSGGAINLMPPAVAGTTPVSGPDSIAGSSPCLTSDEMDSNEKLAISGISQMAYKPCKNSVMIPKETSILRENHVDAVDTTSADVSTARPSAITPVMLASPISRNKEMSIFEILVLLLQSKPSPGKRMLTTRERSHLWRSLYASTQWYLGFTLYLICQLFGSVVALGFISPVILAPLGSAGLIFNILFSSIFAGTRITRYDWAGTVLIVIGCAVVSTFGSSMPDSRQSIEDLIRLYSRPAFIAYFSVQLILVSCTFFLIKYLEFNLFSMRSLISRSSVSSLSALNGASQLTSVNAPSPQLYQHTQPTRNQSETLPENEIGSASRELVSSTSMPELKRFEPIFSAEITPELISSQRRVGWTDSPQMDSIPIHPSMAVSDSINDLDHFPTDTNVHQGDKSVSIFCGPSPRLSTNVNSGVTNSELLNSSTLDPVVSTHQDHFTPVGSISRRYGRSISHMSSDETRPLLNGSIHRRNTLRDSVSMRSVTIKVKRGQLTSLVGVLYAIVGGITASETLLLTKSGVELIVMSIFGSNNQFQGAFSFLLLALLALTIFLQLYSLNKALHYCLPVLVIPIFYTLFTCLSLANSMVYLDAFGVYSTINLICLILGIAVIVMGVCVLGKGQDDSDCDNVVDDEHGHHR